MKRHSTTALLWIIAVTALATQPTPDILLHNGMVVRLDPGQFPLESYFRAGHKRPEFAYYGTYSSALERGYIATWEIKESKFYLVGVDCSVIDEKQGVLRPMSLYEIFPAVSISNGVHATWFSGDLSSTVTIGTVGSEPPRWRLSVTITNGIVTRTDTSATPETPIHRSERDVPGESLR